MEVFVVKTTMPNHKKKKKVEPDDPEQSAKFIDAAEKLDLVDNPKQAFEKALKKIAKATSKKKTDSHNA